jgi:hypothetical protein
MFFTVGAFDQIVGRFMVICPNWADNPPGMKAVKKRRKKDKFLQ